MSEQSQSSLRLRAATESDIAFIFNSWLKCYRHSDFAKEMQNEVYFAAQHKVIESLFKKSTITIACNPADATQIIGYMCHEQQDGVLVVHFAYVKESFRGLGVAKALLANTGHTEGPFCYTHRTHSARKFEKKHPLVYHPYLAFHAYEAK